MSRPERRFTRQTARLRRSMPWLAGLFLPGSWLRIPLAVVMILGGLLGFLPVLGFWMLPLGVLLLAVDLPALRPLSGSAMIRFRQLGRRWRRRMSNGVKRDGGQDDSGRGGGGQAA